MEGVEVVLWVHRRLHPDLLRSATEASSEGVTRLSGKCVEGAQDVERVILLVACSGHVPRQFVQASLDVFVVLCRHVCYGELSVHILW